jgi:glutamate racemase
MPAWARSVTDARPIGVFDSGVGGLTVLRALKRALPAEPTVYLGDTARVPYGTRSAATVTKYAINNARTLVALADIKFLVVACNTATAHALPELQQHVSVPVVGVVEPGARAAVSASKGGTIVVLGTAGTVKSGAYARALASLGAGARVHARACPLFVPLVEEGWTSGEVPALVARQYLADLPSDADTVVMGCTHYPLIVDVLRAALPPSVALVDGAEATAKEVAHELGVRGLSASEPRQQAAAPRDAGGAPPAKPAHRLLVTDAPEQLARVAPAFLGEPVDVAHVELVDVMMTA